MIAIDTECTGLDIRHGAKPYLVTICNEEGVNTWWEWDVDPLTREPNIPKGDLVEIQKEIDNADKLILQNPKYDVAALQAIYKGKLRWDWDKVYDTLLAGHLLASNQPHDLTTMVMVYLGLNVQPYEDAIEKATKEARNIARKDYKDWRIASNDLPEMPSAKKKVWKYDMWLPAAIARERKYPTIGNKDYGSAHAWYDLCSAYANSDSASTLPLFKRQRELLEERGLWKIYLERLKILHCLCKTEGRGITLSRQRKGKITKTYVRVAEKCKQTCIQMADGEIEKLPITGVSNALRDVVFGKFGLVSNRKTKGGKSSMDKDVISHWLDTVPPRSKAYKFIESLGQYRKRATALSYLKLYERFWLPLVNDQLETEWFRLHPSLNPTGTVTIRMSSSNPCEQNISKKEDFNLRYVFGPAPGREWWSLDYDNLELRIPGYESGERAMIDIFEKPNEPPYYGSYHLLICHLLHRKRFDKCVADGVSFKERYKSTWYGWTKNFNFADQYGAMESSGTADRAAHVPGAQKLVNGRLKEKSKLNQKWIGFAEKHGYVETMPDKEIDPERGYPLLCSRSRWGKIMPTIPLNYHVQGTACWVMMRAMIKVQEYLDRLNERAGREDYFIIMNVHDEIVLDFPKGKKQNLPKVKKIRRLMESIGDAIGVPLTCGIDYHPNNWSEGVSVE